MPRPRRPERFTPAQLPELVHDLLETHAGEWLTTETIVDRVIAIRPAARPDSVKRAVERALRTYDLETRRINLEGWRTTRQIRARHRSYLEASA